MPYRIDLGASPPGVVDILIELGALDIEQVDQGWAAIVPDGVTPDTVAGALGVASVKVSHAVGRDNGSVWLLSPRVIRIGEFLIASPEGAAPPKALRLADAGAFGSGHHPTTVLCIESVKEILDAGCPNKVLDVGTGSGVLALAALLMGVPQAVGLDIDAAALRAAAENARLNHLSDRLQLILGGPGAVQGTWPLVVANLLAAPLIDLAPVLTQRLSRGGRLVLSGISCSLASEVRQAYMHFGIRFTGSRTRAGWTVLIAQAPW